jgi:prepilin-type N-terminal cleavage/methylation domain-containing protein
MRERASARERGFTLVEMLATMAVILVMAGVVYASLAPVREKAREAHCINNLHQIWHAIQMYRQDYGGQDPPEALTASQLGLPDSSQKLQGYLRDTSVFMCPSQYWGKGDQNRHMASYIWSIEQETSVPPPFLSFGQMVAKHGEETPLISDPHHGLKYRDYDPTAQSSKTYRVVVLRLNGQVKSCLVPHNAPSWDW